MHVFGQWEEVEVPGENPRITQGEQANPTQKGPSWELNQQPSCCEATVLTTTPPSSPNCCLFLLQYPYDVTTTSTLIFS